jgi:hypothetical protein
MRVLTFSRHFPKGHPKAGQPTYFVEKIWKSIWDDYPGASNPLYPYWEQYDQAFPLAFNDKENIHQHQPKHTTIRAGNRWKASDMASLRVWSGVPRRSKQIEFAQVEVKKVWPVEIYVGNLIVEIKVDEVSQPLEGKEALARNDGLELIDFVNWFKMHPKAKKGICFTGQVICWSDKIEYP